MRNVASPIFLAVALSIALIFCGASPSPISTGEISTESSALSSTISVTPAPTQEPTLPPIPVTMQEGNTFPKIGLHPGQSGELLDNRMGAFAGGLTGGGWKPGEPWDYEWMVDQIVRTGVKRFRVSIENLDAGSPDLDWSIPQYTIDPSHDALITRLSQQGITITYVLTFWDKETWPGGKGAACPRFKSTAEVDRYLQFVEFMVHHFKDRIQNYEIWNEPSTEFCPQRIEVDDYIELVRRAVPVIRQEYPQAKIIVGATHYLGEDYSRDYLFKILNSNIMPMVDIISWHPMYGTSPEFDPDYYAKYTSLVQKIKNTATAHGFKGIYEADELTWFTVNGNWDGWSKRYSDTVAAKYFARGILLHLGMDVTAGIGSALIFNSDWVLVPSTIQNLSTIMAGASTASYPVKIITDRKHVVSYSFLLPDGEKLIALWIDDAAIDYDPGVPSVVAISGTSGWKATGIDVLNGFEQDLSTDNEDDNLVIGNLMLKDYPTIIRLSK